ncbi:MAG: hypothetical protein ACOY0T_26690 [Myxococcota bacterium]
MHIYRLSSSEFREWRNRATRENLKTQIHARHGEAQVRAPSGRILGTARSPERSGRIPIERATSRGAHHAVSPRECLCREWQKPPGKEDQHHPICTHKGHWEAQQAKSPDVLRNRALLSAPQPATPPEVEDADSARDTQRPPAPAPESSEEAQLSAAALAPPPAPPPAPADCVCREWSGASESKHHALCQFRERWEREHGDTTPKLVELETGTVIREASPEELEASKAKSEEDGVGAIELSDGKLYYVREAP